MEGEWIDSTEVARAAMQLAMTATREEEACLKARLQEKGILAGAADYGGEFISTLMKIIERSVNCGKREKIIADNDHELGALAGAAHEAVSQISGKAIGLSVGGKIGIARRNDHIVVALFFSVGLGKLDEICIGLGHRVL